MYDQVYKPQRVSGLQKFLIFAGVIMPAISITVEATTHMSANVLFDPIPTTWHLLMVIFVPLAQLHVWFTIRRGSTERLTVPGWANALVIGISLFFSFLYLPILPAAALMLIFGLGFLPLAPLLSLVASIVMRQQLSQLGSNAPKKNIAVTKRGVLIGLAVVVALVGLIELPAIVTRYGLQMATSGSPDRRADGIRFLRTFGNRKQLLLKCYYRNGGGPTEFISYLLSINDPVSPTEARETYYRVTGEKFDTSVPPRRVGARVFPDDEIDFDRDQGGANVGSKLRGLSLTSSSIDVSADAVGGVGYMQWTMLFRNESAAQREARAEVQLPPGAVVSRLTLWVNGEEREAAFAGKAKVTQAYRQIVNQRRDPVLVTTAGRDRILVQCFPVPPGGVMKIRIGVTLPMLLENHYQARVLLPHFNQRNFRIPDDVRHSIWIESKTALGSGNTAFSADQPNPNVYALRGELNDEQLANPRSSIHLDRAFATDLAWSRNPFEGMRHIVQQTVEDRKPKHLKRIALVVDTSKGMQEFEQEIQAALMTLPVDFDLKMVFADSTGINDASTGLVDSGREQIARALSKTEFIGGADNAPALLRAWELAAEKPGHNVIVWIHSPQLLQLGSIDGLRQRWERRPYGPLLYSVQTRPGSDQIEENLDGIHEVRSVPRTGTLREDLEKLFARLTGERPFLELVRTSTRVENYPQPPEATETSDHLARLWAKDEVARILNLRDEALNESATSLAVRYQLVTPVSGAVVLETAEQYRAAGLQPVDAGTVPTIPEPEMVILLLIMAMFVIWVVYQKRRQSRKGSCTV